VSRLTLFVPPLIFSPSFFFFVVWPRTPGPPLLGLFFFLFLGDFHFPGHAYLSITVARFVLRFLLRHQLPHFCSLCFAFSLLPVVFPSFRPEDCVIRWFISSCFFFSICSAWWAASSGARPCLFSIPGSPSFPLRGAPHVPSHFS